MYETIDHLLAGPPSGASEAELVDWIAGLEAVKCTAEAVQAEAAVRLDEAVRARQSEAGVPARRLGEGVASQVALARRVSPEKGAKLLGLAKILTTEMPHTFALMKAGLFSQWQATILARETACLSVDDRRVIDYELCATGPGGQPARGGVDGATAARERRQETRHHPRPGIRRRPGRERRRETAGSASGRHRTR